VISAGTFRWVPALLLVYALLHLAGRVAISDSVELDEAEQVLLAQDFRGGYGRQPPLYSWVQTAAFAVCGTNIFALALVKALFLFTAYYFLYATAKLTTAAPATGLLAVCSLALIPQVAWELQRDLTHSAASVATPHSGPPLGSE
jgi:4-amino-4-deoxy-L-arabinose transferase-like glycosyltransferase